MRVFWLEQTEADVPPSNDWLGPAELDRCNAFRFAKRRNDWRLGRWTAKCALAAYLDDWLKSKPSDSHEKLDEETLRRLRSLGYVQ